ncbi:FadR family transcriptional regulator [Pseudorhodobacter turbinis]|uniref:FadR family transcriptional regulator n=2 Tax=Pseudorhodobacter turbinis TaxID=2500533 RepID=A0A4P8EIF5_9RHOB|nr:FadR family transcriptional regulator [Pseudorhodobacter turbinis]
MAEALSERISNGELKPGERLPTEAALCEEFEVSRTVVREAVARLGSEGLLVSQQGRGMFVSEQQPTRKFELEADNLSSLPETISLLELRLSVEVEAAALCAIRRTATDARKIRRIMEELDSQSADPKNVDVHYDFDFHLTIAQATKNEHIFRFLSFLKPAIAPRFQLSQLVSTAYKDEYYRRVHEEHEAIVVAIEAQASDKAREAMRKHLLNALERLRALSSAAGLNDSTNIDASVLEAFFKT